MEEGGGSLDCPYPLHTCTLSPHTLPPFTLAPYNPPPYNPHVTHSRDALRTQPTTHTPISTPGHPPTLAFYTHPGLHPPYLIPTLLHANTARTHPRDAPRKEAVLGYAHGHIGVDLRVRERLQEGVGLGGSQAHAHAHVGRTRPLNRANLLLPGVGRGSGFRVSWGSQRIREQGFLG